MIVGRCRDCAVRCAAVMVHRSVATSVELVSRSTSFYLRLPPFSKTLAMRSIPHVAHCRVELAPCHRSPIKYHTQLT